MNAIEYLLEEYLMYTILGIIIIIVLGLIIMIIQGIKISKLKKKYNRLFKKENAINIEELLLSQKEQLENVKNANNKIVNDITDIQMALKKCYSKSLIYNYDAYPGIAGRLSFVYVLLDNNNDGVILNGIYSNEGSYLYIKEVLKGKAQKELSKEEIKTLNEVLNK